MNHLSSHAFHLFEPICEEWISKDKIFRSKNAVHFKVFDLAIDSLIQQIVISTYNVQTLLKVWGIQQWAKQTKYFYSHEGVTAPWREALIMKEVNDLVW